MFVPYFSENINDMPLIEFSEYVNSSEFKFAADTTVPLDATVVVLYKSTVGILF